MQLLGVPLFVFLGILFYDLTYNKQGEMLLEKYLNFFMIGTIIYISLWLFVWKISTERIETITPAANERAILRRHIHGGDSTVEKGKRFEARLKALYERKGYYVQLTPDTGDLGADLVLHRNGRKIVVQAKDWGTTRVGPRAIQEIKTAIAPYEADEGWVVVNSYFTEEAERLAHLNNIKIFDRDALHAYERTGIRRQYHRRHK